MLRRVRSKCKNYRAFSYNNMKGSKAICFSVFVFLCLLGAGEFFRIPFDENPLAPMNRFNSRDADHVITFEKPNHSLGKNERNAVLLLLRKIFQQGDVMRAEKSAMIDSLIEKKLPTCDLCEIAVKALQVVFNSETGEDIIATAAVIICEAAHIEDYRVCELAVNEFKLEVFYVLYNLKPQELCFWLLKDKCATKPEGFLPEWHVPIPAPNTKAGAETPRAPLAGKPTSKFMFFTDMHMDVRYKAGASATCGEPLCCRDNDVVPSDAKDGAGLWGDYRNCDMAPWTTESMMKNASNEKLDFIMFTGDIPAHDVWNQTSLDQIDKIQRWTNLLTTYFPDTPVYAAVGNHESAPVNSYPPSSIYSEPGADIQWLYQTLYDSWSHWVPTKDLDTVLEGGYFTTLVQTGLRVISLNTNYCSDDSWWLLVGDNSVDPQGQLKWLVQVLQTAEDNKEKVLIITHRPMDGCMEWWGKNYYDIMVRYQASIVAHLLGHAHTDELKLYYDTNDPSKVASVGLVGPGFTTYSYLNSGYRIYTIDGDYDGSTHMLLDAQNYYLNITDANISNNPVWQHEYSTTEDYGMENLSVASWQKLVDSFETNDAVFQQYHKHISKSEDTSECDADCKKSTICDIKKVKEGQNSVC